MFHFVMDFSVLYFILILIHVSKTEDVFCGGLTVYKQQWLAKAASTISSQTTSDLKECLNICCSIPSKFYALEKYTICYSMFIN